MITPVSICLTAARLIRLQQDLDALLSARMRMCGQTSCASSPWERSRGSLFP
jgi:hypothetical protein